MSTVAASAFVSAIDRIPPNNLEAEMALLGSVLVDKEMMATVAEIVQPSDFYASLHESIYVALSALSDRGEPLDKVALAQELRNRGMLDKIGGLAYLNSLMDTVPTAASAAYYARIVREKSILRALIRASAASADDAYAEYPDAVERAQTALSAVCSMKTATIGERTPTCNLRDLRDSRFERVTFLETNMIPKAELTLANGDGDLGKTTSMLDLLARASAHRPMPSGLRHDRALRALIVAEEDRHGLLRARLDVANADHDNIRLLESVGREKHDIVFPTHTSALRDTIVGGKFDIVLIDAFLNHLADDVNASRPQEMRRALRPLVDVAHETGATIIAIRHLSKGSGPASARGLGSVEARNLSRSELTIARHPDTETHAGLVVMALSKANLSPDHSTTMAFRLMSQETVDDDGLPTTVARVEWEQAPPAISADDLLDRPESGERSRIDAACDWLREALDARERPAMELQRDAEASNFSRATLYRASDKAGVRKRRDGTQSYWSLGVSKSQVSHVSSSRSDETIGNDVSKSQVSQSESVETTVDRSVDWMENLGRLANETSETRETPEISRRATATVETACITTGSCAERERKW